MSDDSRSTRFARLIASPTLMDEICAHLANGGTLVGLAQIWDMPFGIVNNWVRTHHDKRYMQALNDRDEWEKERIREELWAPAFAKLTDAFDDSGELRPMSEWPEAVKRSLSGFEVRELEVAGQKVGNHKKAKFLDKGKMLEVLAKTRGMLSEKIEHTADESLITLIERSMKLKD